MDENQSKIYLIKYMCIWDFLHESTSNTNVGLGRIKGSTGWSTYNFSTKGTKNINLMIKKRKEKKEMNKNFDKNNKKKKVFL